MTSSSCSRTIPPLTRFHSTTSTVISSPEPANVSGSRTIIPSSELPLGSYNITVSSLTMKRINQLKLALQPLLAKPKVQDSKSSHAPVPSAIMLSILLNNQPKPVLI
ncbi:hypothetical protein [Escherichia phage AnYang]|uniref:Uncharacterized protein n=1 Tax=Escherichia phage AnYang TaxID=2499909 RepID=A0A410T4F1_9CAUD|nr:hypothetical protein KNU29_gp035 [Escherichia phage AnYang]QAU03570.1 hypothetical protein [Escherichia phage AnYang]